jgi:hypothetical protein
MFQSEYRPPPHTPHPARLHTQVHIQIFLAHMHAEGSWQSCNPSEHYISGFILQGSLIDSSEDP